MEIRTGWNYALAIERSREPADPVAHMRSLERASRLRARALWKNRSWNFYTGKDDDKS